MISWASGLWVGLAKHTTHCVNDTHWLQCFLCLRMTLSSLPFLWFFEGQWLQCDLEIKNRNRINCYPALHLCIRISKARVAYLLRISCFLFFFSAWLWGLLFAGLCAHLLYMDRKQLIRERNRITCILELKESPRHPAARPNILQFSCLKMRGSKLLNKIHNSIERSVYRLLQYWEIVFFLRFLYFFVFLWWIQTYHLSRPSFVGVFVSFRPYRVGGISRCWDTPEVFPRKKVFSSCRGDEVTKSCITLTLFATFPMMVFSIYIS